MRKRCKACGKRVPQRNNQVNFACQVLGYCRRCYEERFPERPLWNLPPLRWGSEAVLSYDDRRRLTGMTREEMDSVLSRQEELDELIRQLDFYDQWQEYLAHWQNACPPPLGFGRRGGDNYEECED